jgi:hypothetical protein
VVINGSKNILEGSKMPEFSGRPDFLAYKTSNYGNKNRGIVFCDVGPVWEEVSVDLFIKLNCKFTIKLHKMFSKEDLLLDL